MYGYDYFYPSHMFGFGSIFMLLFWVFIIYAAVAFFRHGNEHHHNRSIEILKERYAKGEISKEQFESMKKDIQ